MSNTKGLKNYRLTEYSVLVCILLVKIWCGFANQALLFAVGGVISTAIDLGLCVYLLLNARRRKNEIKSTVSQTNFLLVWLTFAVIYSLVFLVGSEGVSSVSVMGMFELPKMIYNMLFSVIYLCPLIMVVRGLNENERQLVSNLLLVIFFAVALANLITAIMNPELVKNDAYNEGTSLFTLGYSGSYSLMLITPILLYKLGASKHKVVFSLLLACNLASIFYGGYFIAILGTLVALVMYLILSIKNKALVLALGLLLIGGAVAFIISGALEETMWYLADNIEIEVISGRCRDIAQYLSGDTDVTQADTTFRIFIYEDTFNQFLKHPLLGNYIFGNYDCQWDHSTILDLLSVGGIFLCGLFFAVIGFGYKFACAFIKDDRARRALLAAIVAYLFVASVNSALSYKSLGILFVLAPIIMGGAEKNEDTDTPSL